MPFDLPTLQRLCTAGEASLHHHATQIAAEFAPPFTAQTRARIMALLQTAEVVRHSLQRHWSYHIQSPELRALPIHHPDRQYFASVQRHLRLWQPAVDRLLTVVRQRPLPLFPAPPPHHSPEAQAAAAMSRAWDRMHAHLSPTPPNLYHDAPGHHGDLPYPTPDFLAQAMAARRIAMAQGKTDIAFLDVGCGVALKVFQAAELFSQCDGLEYEPAHAAAGQALMQRAGWPDARIFHADALSFDHYGDYDVLYVYKPMYGPALEEMEARLVAQARPGTILIAPYLDFTTRFTDLGCVRLQNFLYIIRPPRGLQRLLRRAGHVGCSLPARPKNGYAEDGFVSPLHLALRRWGHGD